MRRTCICTSGSEELKETSARNPNEIQTLQLWYIRDTISVEARNLPNKLLNAFRKNRPEHDIKW
jgi:hypothetical protein